MSNPYLYVLNPFLTAGGFRNQMEKIKRGAKNSGFQDIAFENMMKNIAGWKAGEEWCMYYCKAVYMQFFSFDREFLKRNFSGGTLWTPSNIEKLNKAGDRRYVFIRENSPQIGDILILRQRSNAGGHAGIVTEVLSNTKVKTIEGNTSLAKVRNGQGVFELERTLEVGKYSAGNSGMYFVGYIRRNFTQDELNRLYYDNDALTLKMRN
jgi:hypothetical protein